MAESPVNPYRLPRTVVPRRYELGLEPDLEAFSFAGTVSIDVQVLEPVGEIVLNAADLEISGGDLDGTALAGVDYDAEHERAVLLLAEPASPGPARLNLSFTGKLNDPFTNREPEPSTAEHKRTLDWQTNWELAEPPQ